MERLVTIEPDRKLYYIYFITHNLTGQVYVGYTVQAEHRWERHKEKAFCDRPRERFYIHKAMAKHGIDNFTYELIEKYDDLEECKQAEIFYIEYLKTIGAKMYNLTKGGEGCTGRKWSDSMRAKRAGFKYSEESKKKMSDAQIGKKHKEDTIKKLIIIQREGSVHRGKLLDENRRKIISETTRGIKKTKGSKITECQAVEIFDKYHNLCMTQKQLSQEYNISQSTVGKIANGKPCPLTVIKDVK